MCGITGMLYFDHREVPAASLEAMMDVIHHRGPDDTGTWTDPGVGLGFRRLSIIDLKEGHQPLCNEDESVWIVFNGEIYNYQPLRERLLAQGHRFRTHTDTEVIVHLYEEYGEDCVKHLRGMFGFVIWDRKRRKLFGARDHFGIKPFYYAHDGKRFLFASEIKSLLTVEGVERRLRDESLLQYLTFQYVPEPNTMFEGIMKLPPAHTVTVTQDGAMKLNRYWDPMFAPVQRPFGDMVEELRAKLKDSVIHHMHSDVERGCFLSSGIDSTAIAAHMRAIEPIRTFSVGFEGPNNETVIAKETAAALGTQHFAKIITERDYFDTVPKAVWHQDEPVADPSAIALYHVAQLARQHVTVVLSGEGADELFGGYRIYREPLALRPLAWLPLPLKRLLHGIARLLPGGMTGRNYLLRATTPLEERFLGNAKLYTEDAKAALVRYDRELLRSYRDPWQVAGDYYAKTKHLDPVTRMQYIDMNLWMPGDILMKADKMTMAHSIELRVPFLDKELFEFARTVPTDYRLGGGTTKYIFRKAMEGIIPDFILNRPKLGFPVPLRDWLKGPRGGELLEQIRASGIGHVLELSEVERMVKQHQSGQGDYSRLLWAVYIFGLWHSTYLQEARSFGREKSVTVS
ncbi:asparagine synthase (glutamine-hydrolyzing) [Paenibacillus flagellatus]|uniref:asparagine synthase (glutamine-hydrolyzing) n=1 Tax=Paenibacillus flagellatus TaxID=2211139 RepID=A0A2V5K479_9BACL|nr:asparagine synthase (glutamine-hydrolyzing) [Paenibacillus flagellatus]PYI54008.1 asparagine synthase (glutamine-hydrolyzing) [Paenibacillus flagellatus]